MCDDCEAEEIRAKGEAEAKVLEARAKLHPITQAIYAFFDSITSFLGSMGCLFIILLIAVAIFAPQLLK